MKIIFMLNLAHTPYTKKQCNESLGSEKCYYTHSRAETLDSQQAQTSMAERDVQEIYWNIKFNHGMESINNTYVTLDRSEEEKIDWMEGKSRRNAAQR
jgi:hypothetical protein